VKSMGEMSPAPLTIEEKVALGCLGLLTLQALHELFWHGLEALGALLFLPGAVLVAV